MYDNDITLADGTVVHQFNWTTPNGMDFQCIEDPSYEIRFQLFGKHVLKSAGSIVGHYGTLAEAIQAANRGELPT